MATEYDVVSINAVITANRGSLKLAADHEENTSLEKVRPWGSEEEVVFVLAQGAMRIPCPRSLDMDDIEAGMRTALKSQWLPCRM